MILPEGKMRLRIFEPRYKRLVSQAMKSDGTFGICLYDREGLASGEELSQIGTLKITDFELLEDGLLGISVTGISKFKILRVRTEHDGLLQRPRLNGCQIGTRQTLTLASNLS